MNMIVRFGIVVCVSILAFAGASQPSDYIHNNGKNEGTKPYLEVGPSGSYHGLIKENETTVEVTPPIHAIGPVCSFLIFNNKHGGQAPFHIRLIGNNVATLHTRKYLDCEARRNYKFEMAAVGCDGQYGNTAWVHVTVVDVNEYSPEFSQSSYVRTVQGGGPRDGREVARVDATDKDCTPKYGDICKYEILTPDQPFTIDNEGIIRSTEPLDYERSHNHILSVVAYDCGMRQSTPVMVTIKVEKPCKAGWKGLAERVDYAPSTGPLSLFPSASLEACSSDAHCPGVTRIRAEVALKASHAGRGCDRDTYSTGDQQRVCGIHSQAVDLLPSPGFGTEWTKVLRSNEGHESDQMFEFDGETTAAVVPDTVLNHSLAGTFSVSTWMRHAPRPDLDKHGKEHILCLADDHQMNRHHYALFVRNCRLIFLLRRDFGEGDLNIFRPAEWRWKIPEVCDDEWHHYSLHVRFPNAELYVDGEPYRGDGKNPEVIDDWPLHPTKDINTTLTVGACWQGTDSKMKHFLKGSLAGLNVLLHGVEGRQQLKCVAQCREGLSLAPDLFLKSVSVEGDSAADVETLLRKVTYTNSRAFPTPGRRNVHIATTVTCDNGSTMEARPAESYIMVLRPASPSVLISGSAEASQDYTHFRSGVPVFPDVTVRVVSALGETPEDPEAQRLDSCVVSVYPALNPDHESLSLHAEARDVRAAINRDGVILSGADHVQTYQKVLREISYTNKKPAYYLNRVFKLTCSELNGRFTSNEYVQTLTVVHPHMSGHDEHSNSVHHDLHSGMANKMESQDRTLETISKSHILGGAGHLHHGSVPQAPARQYAAHALRAQHSVEGPHYEVREHSDTNHAALLIGVICAGFLVLAAAVGLARARGGSMRHRLVARATTAQAAKGAASPADAEMAWDDSALTITVNPMETSEGVGGDVESGPQSAPGHSSDSDSCSDSDSDQPDSEEEEEEEVVNPKQHKYKNINQLEWDNSTM